VGGGNRVGFSDPRADEILDQVVTEFDDERRHALLKELHAILHAQQPVTALFTPAVNAGINRRWRGVRVYEGRGVDIYEWWLPREERGATDVIPPRGEDK
jgi:ABC-type transport system substrate-binding protein